MSTTKKGFTKRRSASHLCRQILQGEFTTEFTPATIKGAVRTLRILRDDPKHDRLYQSAMARLSLLFLGAHPERDSADDWKHE
jgi:hypothetical protein